MNRLEKLQTAVHDLYAKKDPNREDWADWLYDNHVLVVAKYARELAKKYGANEELSEAAALLHDIADVKMSRFDESHEAESLAIARQEMVKAGYSPDEIKVVVDDAVLLHSCHDDKKPSSTEGLILATADAMAHFKTDYYVHAAWAFGKDRTMEVLKAWTLKKIDRDLHIKISFEDERQEVAADYEAVKRLFSR